MAETIYKFIKAKKTGASVRDFHAEHQTPLSTVNKAFMALQKSGYIMKSGKRKGRGEVLYIVVKGKDL